MKKRKPTNKDFKYAIQDLRMHHLRVQTQLNALMEMWSDFMEFTGQKDKFLKYLEEKMKNAPEPEPERDTEVVE